MKLSNRSLITPGLLSLLYSVRVYWSCVLINNTYRCLKSLGAYTKEKGFSDKVNNITEIV